MLYVVVVLILLLAGLIYYVSTSGPVLPLETEAIIEGVLNRELPEIIVGQTGFAPSDGLQIWYESIQPEGTPQGTVLLIMANGGDALFWPPKFVRAFVEAGYQTIRYDHRGTGMSDWVENWDRKNPYSVADLAGDVVAVLDACKVQQAHLVGLSMGGMVAQEVAIQCPDRVALLTLMMTSAYIGDPDLPGLTSSYFFRSLVKGLPLLKYRMAGGESNLIKERIAKTIQVAGTEGLDIQELAELVLYDLRKRRGIHLKGAFQHQTAITIAGSRVENLKSLRVPTLVIHGMADELIPPEHGKKLVEVIPGATGVWLEGVGHVFPVPDQDALTQKILSYLDFIHPMQR